ncbi:MAG: hypothetical protein AB1778_00290 [Candidatus Bipolaricaulota bacterium]
MRTGVLMCFVSLVFLAHGSVAQTSEDGLLPSVQLSPQSIYGFGQITDVACSGLGDDFYIALTSTTPDEVALLQHTSSGIAVKFRAVLESYATHVDVSAAGSVIALVGSTPRVWSASGQERALALPKEVANAIYTGFTAGDVPYAVGVQATRFVYWDEASAGVRISQDTGVDFETGTAPTATDFEEVSLTFLAVHDRCQLFTWILGAGTAPLIKTDLYLEAGGYRSSFGRILDVGPAVQYIVLGNRTTVGGLSRLYSFAPAAASYTAINTYGLADVSEVRISPDGATLWLSGRNGADFAVVALDAMTLRALRGYEEPRSVSGLIGAFSTDGAHAVLVSGGSVAVWRIAPAP